MRPIRPLFIIGAILFLFVVGRAAFTQGAPGDQWQASYWNNVDLSGSPDLTRREVALDHDWGYGSPPGIGEEAFSARWTRRLDLPAGRYRFTATVDDGIRVWVNGLLLINGWRVQSLRTFDAEMDLPGGEVPVRVEYFEGTGQAQIQLTWDAISIEEQGWYAEYYNNRNLAGTPALIREDSSLSFNWGAGSPAPDEVPLDNFSARWRRTLALEPGLYRFSMTIDDGARLYVGDRLLIDNWQTQPASTYSELITLPGGDVPVTLEYFEQGGQAQVSLSWTRLGDPPAEEPATPLPPPTLSPVLVDDSDPGFRRGGRDAWDERSLGYNNSTIWTYNSKQLPDPYNWGLWRPSIQGGQYEVSVYIPQSYATTNQARYWISHALGLDLRIVDQAANRGQWVSLGSYTFAGDGGDYVSLTDITFEERNSTMVGYDAVLWTPPACHPSYLQLCVPRDNPDVTCEQLPGANFPVISSDPLGLDEDGDGIACDSQ